MRSLISLFFLLILSSNLIFGQNVQTLPKDPRIKTGKMANGFTYYLVKSDKMKGFADFYLVQKVGSVLEENNQKGLSDIIGDMGIRGTRNFPGYTIISYIDQLGMETGTDFRIVNNFSNSIYRMANVPVGRGPLVVDSTLLILFNWACSINIDEEDVQKEKEYYKNIYVKKMDLQHRTSAEHIRNLFPGTGFDVPAADSMFQRFESYSSKDIRSYYYKWYRPELQSLVVVGDIDSLALDTQIKTLFQATPRYLEKVEKRKPYIVPMDGLKISMVPDKEAEWCEMDIYFKTTPLPANLRKSAVPFVMDYMNDMMSFLLQDRLSVMAYNNSVPILDISAGYGSFMGIGEMESLHIKFKTSPECADTVLGLVTDEVYGVKNTGFTREEFLSARDRYFKNLNYIYDWRIYTTNDTYARRCIGNYLGDYSLASIEMNKEYMDVVWYEITLAQFNTFVSSYIRRGENCTITCSYPSNAAVIPSAKKLEAAFNTAKSNSSLPYSFSPIVDELMVSEPKAGTIVSETKEPITNSVMWTLSNGATVLFKNTQSEPNKVSFRAVAKGGLSLMNGSTASALKYINDIAKAENLGIYTAGEIQRYMNLRGISLQKEMTISTSGIYGDFLSTDIKGFMDLLYLHFKDPNENEMAFQNYRRNKIAEMKYAGNNPDRQFSEYLSESLYTRSGYSPSSDADILDVDFNSLASFIRQSYSNAANFTFMFAGDADAGVLKEFVCKYIGSLPGNPNRKDNWRVVPLYLQKRDTKSHYDVEMELPRNLYNMTLAGAAPFNMEDMAVSNVISSLIDRRMKWGMLERGISMDINTEFKKYPEEFMTISLSFVTKDYSDDYIGYLYEILKDLETSGVNQDELNIVKSVSKAKSSFREKTQNAFWLDILTSRFIYGKDFYTKQSAVIDALTLDRVNGAMANFLENCSHTVLTMSPAN